MADNINEDVKWYYDQLNKAGMNVGTEEEFNASLSNKEDRDWYYEQLTKSGLNVGTQDDFEKSLGSIQPAGEAVETHATDVTDEVTDGASESQNIMGKVTDIAKSAYGAMKNAFAEKAEEDTEATNDKKLEQSFNLLKSAVNDMSWQTSGMAFSNAEKTGVLDMDFKTFKESLQSQDKVDAYNEVMSDYSNYFNKLNGIIDKRNKERLNIINDYNRMVHMMNKMQYDQLTDTDKKRIIQERGDKAFPRYVNGRLKDYVIKLNPDNPSDPWFLTKQGEIVAVVGENGGAGFMSAEESFKALVRDNLDMMDILSEENDFDMNKTLNAIVQKLGINLGRWASDDEIKNTKAYNDIVQKNAGLLWQQYFPQSKFANDLLTEGKQRALDTTEAWNEEMRKEKAGQGPVNNRIMGGDNTSFSENESLNRKYDPERKGVEQAWQYIDTQLKAKGVDEGMRKMMQNRFVDDMIAEYASQHHSLTAIDYILKNIVKDNYAVDFVNRSIHTEFQNQIQDMARMTDPNQNIATDFVSGLGTMALEMPTLYNPLSAVSGWAVNTGVKGALKLLPKNARYIEKLVEFFMRGNAMTRDEALVAAEKWWTMKLQDARLYRNAVAPVSQALQEGGTFGGADAIKGFLRGVSNDYVWSDPIPTGTYEGVDELGNAKYHQNKGIWQETWHSGLKGSLIGAGMGGLKVPFANAAYGASGLKKLILNTLGFEGGVAVMTGVDWAAMNYKPDTENSVSEVDILVKNENERLMRNGQEKMTSAEEAFFKFQHIMNSFAMNNATLISFHGRQVRDFLFKSRYTQEDIRHAIMEENQRRQGMLKFATTEEERAACRPMTADQEGLFIKQMGFTDGDGNLKSEYHLLDLVGNMKRNIMEMNRTGYFERTMRFTDSDKALLNRLDPRLLTAMEDISLYASDLSGWRSARQEANAAKIINSITEFCADQRIPQQLITKLMYRFTGRIFSPGMVDATEIVDDAGRYTVRAYSADGRLIDSQSYDTSEEAEKAEMRYNSQKEYVAIQKNAYSILGEEINRNFYKWLVEDYSKIDGTWLASAYGDSEDGYAVDYEKRLEALLQGRERKLTLLQESVARVMNAIQKHTDPRAVCPDDYNYVVNEYSNRCTSLRDIRRKVAEKMGVDEGLVLQAIEGRKIDEAKYLDKNYIEVGDNIYRTQQDQKIVDAYLEELKMRNEATQQSAQETGTNIEALKTELKSFLSAGEGATPVLNRMLVEKNLAEQTLRGMGIDPEEAKAIAIDTHRSAEERMTAQQYLNAKEGLEAISETISEMTESATEDKRTLADMIENVSITDETPMEKIITATFGGQPVYVWKGDPAADGLLILKDKDGNIVTDANGRQEIPSDAVENPTAMTKAEFLAPYERSARVQYQSALGNAQFGINVAKGETITDKDGTEHTVIDIQEDADKDGRPVTMVVLGNNGETTSTVSLLDAVKMRNEGIKAQIERENTAIAERMRLEEEAAQKREEEAALEQASPEATVTTETPAPDTPQTPQIPEEPAGPRILQRLPTTEDGKYDYTQMTPEEAVSFLNGETIENNTNRVGRRAGYANDIAKQELDMALKALAKLRENAVKGANQAERDASLTTAEKDAKYLEETINFWGKVLNEAGKRQSQDESFTGVFDTLESYELARKSPETYEWMNRLAQSLGYKVGLIDSRSRAELSNTKNGKNDLGKKTIWLNMYDAGIDITPEGKRLTYRQYVGQVFGHELTHTFFSRNRRMLNDFIAKTKTYLGDEAWGQKIEQKIREYLKRSTYNDIYSRADLSAEEKREMALNAIKTQYGVDYTNGLGYIEEEIACDMAGQFFGDGNGEYMRHLAMGDFPRPTDKSIPVKEEQESTSRVNNFMAWVWNKIEGLFRADEAVDEPTSRDMRAEQREELMQTYANVFDAMRKEMAESHSKNNDLRIEEAKKQERLAAEAAERNRILEQEKKDKDAVFEPYEKIVTDVRNAVDDCKSLDAKIRKAKEMLYGYEEALMELDDMEPQTLEEYVSNIGSRVLAWEDKDVNGHTVRGLKTELGLKRGVTGSDTTGINDFLAKNGEGKGIDEYVHSLWEGLPENLRHYNDTDVKAALLDVLSASTSAKDTREMTGRNRLTRALNIFEDSIMRDAEADYASKYVMVNGRMMPRTPGEIEADAISEEMSQDSSQPMPFSLRQEPAPKRRKYGYKAFKLGKDGKLYPPMVDNPGGDATPVGLFLNADAGVRAGKSATGREKVGQRGGGSLSFRPAWHLGYQPNAKQFYGRGENEGKAKGDIVWALVEFDATNDYSFEADAFGLNKNGTWQHSYMGCPYIPENGYYEMRTNPNPSTDAWALSGAMRVIHMLSRAEEADVLSRSGVQKPELYTEDVLTDDVVARINREIDSNLRQNMGDDEYINMKDAISKVMKMNFEEMHDYVYEDTESDYVGEKHNPTLDELRAVRSDEDAERAYRYYQIIRRGGDDAETLRRMIDEQKSAIINEESDAVKNRLKRAQKAWYEEKSKELETMSNADLHESVNIDEPSPERDIVILDEKGEFKSSTNSETGQALFSLRTFDEDGRETLDEFLRAQVGRGVLTEDDAKEIGTAMEKIYEDAMKIYDSGEYETFNDWSMQPIKVTKDGSVIYSVIKPNAEYGMNLDFSLICKKRRTLDAVLNQMTERGLIDMLPSSNDDISIAIINDIIREYGFETACKLCFVDAKRFRQAKVADDFVQLYNGLVKSMIPRGSKIKANYFDFAGEGRESVDDVIALDKISDDLISFDKLKKVMQSNGDATVMYKVAKYLLENPSERRLLQRSDFMGSKGFDAVTKYSQEKGAEIDERRRQAGEEVKSNEKSIRGLYNSKKGSGGPKSSESDIQYLNDVAKANWKPEKAFAVGGVRVQSFSDFVPHMVFDYAQMFAELAAGKLPAHAYTKEELFVKMFGKTGIKINMSLVPKVVEDGIAAGLDKDGNYVWDINRDENGNIIQAESFDYDEAVRIQNDPAYRNNCGTIAVGVSDAHIRKMLLDPNIRMVIPYHASGINKKVAVHNGINRFTDYTNTQNTRYADTGKKLSKADHAKEKGFNVYLKECGDPTKAVDAYIKDCKKKGWIPKFDQFLDKEYKEDGAYKDKDGKRYDYKQSEGYYKLLEDYTTYIPDGKGGFEYHPQEALKFELPKEGDTFGSFGELMRRGLSEDEAVEAKRTNEVSPIVDEIERRLKTNGTVRESVREDVPAIKEGESLMDYSKRVSEWREEKKDERFSNRVANSDPFMSNAAVAVTGIKQNKATGDQWLAMMQKNGGLKAEEDKWMGLSEWLKGQKSVTKEEVRKFIADNAVKVEEVEYANPTDIDGKRTLQSINDEYREEIIKAQSTLTSEEIEGMSQSEIEGTVYDRAFKSMVDKYGDDFELAFEYDRYNIIANVDWNDEPVDAAKEFLFGDNKLINTTRLEYTTDGLTNKREIALTVPTIEPYNQSDNIHFGDADKGRAVAWLRFGDAETVDGEKVLVIDEIQSKRHQDGREKGYVVDAYDESQYETRQIDDFGGEKTWIVKDKSTGKEYKIGSVERFPTAKDAVLFHINYASDRVPDAPFRKNWHELAMKRALRYAAENGYDKVAWTTGAQQAARYDLSKVLDTVTKDSWDTDETHTMLRLDFKNETQETLIVDNATGVITKGIWEGDKLSDVVGKDIASKMMSMPEDKTQPVGSGLLIGGEGMKGFYDRMLPQFMDKYGKKWGVKTGIVELNLPNEADRVMHSVDVTSEMKESVMQGQVMFSNRETLATAGTLFSGGGTLEQGLKGIIEPKFAAEWDKKIQGVYSDNNGDHIIFADATGITLPDIMKATDGGHVDYLHTSPVCKNFSGANTRKGTKVSFENDLKFGASCARAIVMTEPDVYTLENVPQYVGSEPLKKVTDMLDTLGYTYDINVVDSSDYGAATSRKRMILRAVKPGLTLPPIPAHKAKGDWYARIQDLIENEISETGQDIAYRVFEDAGESIDVNKPFLLMGMQYGKWRIAPAGKPAPTIMASSTGNEYVIDPNGTKDPNDWWVTKVTPRMLARIQGLDDSYKLPEQSTLAHTVIGNGIPVELTREFIAPLIKSRITERRERKEASRRIEKKYDNLAMMYIPEFSRGTQLERDIRKIFDEYVLNQADDGIVPFLAPHMNYKSKGVSATSHKIKGEKYAYRDGKKVLIPIREEAQMEAIEGAATDMATMVPENSVLVPIPSHTGEATSAKLLAEAISRRTGAPVLDALTGLNRRSMHDAKMNGGKMTPERMGIQWKGDVEKPEGKHIIYIDNVIDSGATAAAAVRAGRGGVVLAYSYAGETTGNAIPLKSAELVTYGEDGRVVPLNERFDAMGERRGDIRYSNRIQNDPIRDEHGVLQNPKGMYNTTLDTEGKARMAFYGNAKVNRARREIMDFAKNVAGGRISDASAGAFNVIENGYADPEKQKEIGENMVIYLTDYKRTLDDARKEYTMNNGKEALRKNDFGALRKMSLPFFEEMAEVDKAIKWYKEFANGEHNKAGDHFDDGIRYSQRMLNYAKEGRKIPLDVRNEVSLRIEREYDDKINSIFENNPEMKEKYSEYIRLIRDAYSFKRTETSEITHDDGTTERIQGLLDSIEELKNSRETRNRSGEAIDYASEIDLATAEREKDYRENRLLSLAGYFSNLQDGRLAFDSKVGYDKILQILNDYAPSDKNGGKAFMRIFDSVNYTAKNLVTKLSVTNDNTALGKHEWGGDLSLNLNALSQTCYSSGDIAETLLHEMIHRVTSYAIRLYDKDNGKYRNLLSEGQRQAVKELKSLLGKLKSHPEAFAEGADTYGLSKEAETIAETARLKFRRETNMAQLYEDGILKSLWNAIKRFFHLPADELYSKRMERIIKMIAQDYNAQLYDFYGNKTTPDHLMNETRYSGRGSNGRYSIRQRQGESDEEFALRQDETLRSRQMNLDGEQARKMVIAEIKNAIDSKMATNMIKSDLNRLLARVQQATPENVLTVARMVQNDARDVQTRMLGLQLYQLMNLKTQDRNGKNMSIAKNVSNDVRVVLDNIKGRMYGVMHTDADEAMGRLRSENRRITEEIRRARLEMEREHYQEGTTEYDNAMNFIRELEAKIEANKTSIKELDAKKEETIRQNLTTGEGDLQKQLDALEQHAEDCADPDNPAVWTAEDNQKYATLEILKQRLDIETTDAQIRDFEEQKRNATNAGQRRALESVIDNLKRERLIQMRTLVQSVQDLVDGGRTALNMRKAAEIEHRRELIRGMMGDIDGGNDEKRTEREMEKRQEEGSFKKLATAGLGSFEYMAHRIDINHMSHDGWFYKTFVTGKHGVMEAENNYLRNMQESMDSLQSKTEEILGKSVEQVAEEQNKRYDSTGITLARQDQNGMEMPREEVRDLSKAEATYLWMVWKMPDGRAKMENEGYDERTMSEIREFIGDKNVAWTDWIQQEYLPGIFTRYNGRYQEMYGTPMMATENYVPLRYNGEDISEKADLSGDKVKFDTMQIKNGSMINRTQNLNRISRTTNAFNLICEHVNEAEEYTAFARVRKDLEDILNSKAVRNQLNANVAGQYNALREACSIAVHAFNEKISGVDRAVSVMTKGLIGANIAFRNSTALKQILSVPAFLGYSQDPRFIASFLKNVGVEYAKNAGAVASTMATFGFSYNKMMERIQKGNKGVTGTGLSKTIAWCVENMPSFRERVMKGNMGIEALENGGTDASQFEQMLDKYLQYGMNSNKLIDAITCSVGIKSIYDYRYARLKEQGMTDGEARRMALMEADIYYNGTQQSNHVAFMSPIQVSKTSVNRMLSVYQNASIGFARKFAESTQNLSKSVHVNRMIDTYASEYERDGMDAIEARAKAKDVVWNQIRKAAVSALIYGIGTNLIWDLGSRGLIGLFMSDDEKKKALAWTSLISYPMRGMPLFNAGASLISSAASIGTGEEAQMSEYNPMLLFASINDALQAVGRSAKDFGFLSPMTAVKVLDRGLSLAGFRPEIWANTVLGVTDLVKDGLIEGKDVDKMTDLMLLLQTPNSLRPSVAKTLYGIDEESMKEMSDEERKEAMSKYVKSIMYAMKYVDEGDWGMYVPGMKVLKADQRKKVIDGLIKEAIPEDILKSMEKEDKDLKKQLDTIRKTDELSKMFDEETDLEKKKQIGKKLKTEIKADEDAPVEEFVGNALDKYFLTVSPSKAQQTADAYMELSTSDDIREDLMVDKVYSQLKKSVIDPQEDLKGDALSEFKAAHEDDIKKYNKLKRLRSGVKKAKGISDYKSMLIKDGADKEELMQKIRELRKEALSVIGQ